jgi:hypothetical protein
MGVGLNLVYAGSDGHDVIIKYYRKSPCVHSKPKFSYGVLTELAGHH